jgi:hypothetical protein
MDNFKPIKTEPLPEMLTHQELADLLENRSHAFHESDPYLYELMNVAADVIRRNVL